MHSREFIPQKSVTATFNGKPFWSGEVDFRDGVINEVHTKEQAEAADHHHSFYFSPAAVERMSIMESLFFWVENDGKINLNWVEGQNLSSADERRLRRSILSQIKLQSN